MSTVTRQRFKGEIGALRGHLKGKMTIFSGHSGVGKSSLVNLFDPEITQEVEPQPEIKSKGRHTTTYASLIKLGTGGYVIDTPGIGSFAMADRAALEWCHGFLEIRAMVGSCKFRECRHIDEPGCSVLVKLAEGAIDPRRYQSYANLVLGETGREGRVRGHEKEVEEEDSDDPGE